MPPLGEQIRQISFKQGCPLASLDLSITEVHVVEAISQPFEVQVTLEGGLAPRSIRTADLIGSDAGITVGKLHWHGIVRAFGYVSASPSLASNIHQYRAVIVPKLWSLGLSSHNRIFNDLSAADIVQKICADYGLPAPKNSNLLGSNLREICIQYGETDLAFLARLCAEQGVCYRFEHSASQSQLALLRAPESGTVDLAAEDLAGLSFLASLHAGQVQHCDYDDKMHQGESVSVKSTSAFAQNGSSMAAFGGAQFGAGSDTAQHSLISNTGKDYATYLIRQLESAANGTGCEFTLGDVDALDRLALKVGSCVKGIEAVDALSPLKTLVTRIEVSAAESYDGGSSESVQIRCAQAVDYYCEAVPPKPRPLGPLTGIVTQIRASEGNAGTDPGRHVKVKFPWNEDQVSCWLRVAQSYAGPGWGASFVPRVNQEVLVEFLNGDIDRPVVVGALYNGKNAGPEYTATQSGFKTEGKDKKNFNELRFDDKADAQEVYLEAGKDLNYLVHNNRSGTVEKDYTLTVKGERAVTVEKDFTTTVKKTRKDTTTDVHTIESNKSIELKVGGCSIKIETSGITIEAMGNTIKLESAGISVKGTTLKMNSQSTAELKANASVSVEGSGMAELKSSGMTTIKGSMTMIN